MEVFSNYHCLLPYSAHIISDALCVVCRHLQECISSFATVQVLQCVCWDFVVDWLSKSIKPWFCCFDEDAASLGQREPRFHYHVQCSSAERTQALNSFPVYLIWFFTSQSTFFQSCQVPYCPWDKCWLSEISSCRSVSIFFMKTYVLVQQHVVKQQNFVFRGN